MNIPRFRVFYKRSKRMYFPQVISYDASGKMTGFIIRRSGEEKDISKFIVMQSTGLTDKNGVEIFEGDIIKLDVNNCGKIIIADIKHGEYFYYSDGEYNCKRYGWYIDHEWSGYTRNTGYCLNDYKCRCEVIGNIYENPELLEGKSNIDELNR